MKMGVLESFAHSMAITGPDATLAFNDLMSGIVLYMFQQIGLGIQFLDVELKIWSLRSMSCPKNTPLL